MTQSKYVLDMTKGRPAGLMLRFAFPIFLSQLFQQLYNTADTMIVGRYLGTEALAAVSSSGTLIFLLISFFVGLTMGAGVVISRYFGAGETDKVSRAIHTSILVGLISGLLLTVLGMVFTPALLRLMNTDPDVMPQAEEYFFYFFAGGISLSLYNTLRGIMNALGDSKRPLYFLIVSSVLNIVLDWFLIGPCHCGVWAAAVATVLAEVLSCVLCLIPLVKKGQIYTLSLKKLRLDRPMLREIVRIGFPSGVTNSVIGLANVVVQSRINLFGACATAGYGAYSKLEGFAFLPVTSFNMAITTFVSQNLGAGLKDRTRRGARFGILSAMVLAELTGVILFLSAPVLIGLFDDNPDVISYGVTQIRTEAFFYCLLALSHAIASVCRGAGRANVPMFIMLGIWCVLRVIYIMTVMKLLGEIRYVYMAYPITWTISSVIYLFYYFRSGWINGFS